MTHLATLISHYPTDFMKVHRLTTNQNIMSGIHTDFWKTIQMTTENYLLPHKATANW